MEVKKEYEGRETIATVKEVLEMQVTSRHAEAFADVIYYLDKYGRSWREVVSVLPACDQLKLVE